LSFNCTDINGFNIGTIILSDNGEVMGVIIEDGGESVSSPSAKEPIEEVNSDVQYTGGKGYKPPPCGDPFPPCEEAQIRSFESNQQLSTPSQECCEFLGYTFDVETNKCYWSQPCDIDNEFKIIVNPVGDDGALFEFGENENCVLEVKFDYIVEFNCDVLLNCYQEQVTNIQTQINETQTQINELSDLLEQLNQQFQDECVKECEDYIVDTISGFNGLVTWIKPDNTATTIVDNAQCCVANRFDAVPVDDGFECYDPNIIQIKPPDEVSEETLLRQLEFTNDEEEKARIEGELNQRQSSTERQFTFNPGNFITGNTCVNLQFQIIVTENQIIELTEQITILTNQLNTILIEILSNFHLNVTIETVEDVINNDPNIINTGSTFYQTVFEDVLFNINDLISFLTNNQNTGILFNGGDCQTLINTILTELGDNCTLVNEKTFNSKWLTYSTVISDDETLALINGKKIKLGIKIINKTCDFNLLLDRIELNKDCVKIKRDSNFITTCPGFELERKIDNKKSWVTFDDKVNRQFSLTERETDYYINHHRLGINTKEIDLNVDSSRAIETNFFYYILNNKCLLNPCITGSTSNSGITTQFDACRVSCYLLQENSGLIVLENNSGSLLLENCLQINACGDTGLNVYGLLISDISKINTPDNFISVLETELVDVKTRKTLLAYPTLRLIYDRYLFSEHYCNTISGKFTYDNINDFTGLIGSYWVDLIEQVIPSTTIWGSTYVYRNTIFDKQKFKYRKHSLFECKPSSHIDLPVVGESYTTNVVIEDITEAIYDEIEDDETTTPTVNCFYGEVTTYQCDGVFIMQTDDGSEFVGSVKVLSNPEEDIENPPAGEGDSEDSLIIIGEEPSVDS
jgi:hypothetical protein